METLAKGVEDDGPKELSWAGRPLRELMRLAWPITVSTLSYSVMTLVDTILVGRLGPAELAGVGLGGTAAFVVLCFSFGLLRGAKTLVAQAVGARRHDEVGAHLAAALLSAVGIGLLSIGAGVIVAELIARISATASAGAAAETYLRIRILGAPMALVYVALREVRYGQGDARSPMIATITANVVNIVLAYWFIFGLGLGVAGAAWATVVAHAVEAGMLVLVQTLHGWHGLRRMTGKHVRALWRIGLPTGLQFTLEIGSFAMLAGMLAAMSEVAMAAHQIALQVIHFSFLPAYAVGEAASVLTGQAIGAGRNELVNRVARQGLFSSGVYTTAWTIALAVGAPLIVSGFTSEPTLAREAVHLLYVAAVFQIFDGANVVARGALRGCGDVRYPAVIGVVTSWALTPPLTWLLGWHLGLGALGGWLGLCAEIVVGAIILWRRLEGGAWRTAIAQ